MVAAAVLWSTWRKRTEGAPDDVARALGTIASLAFDPTGQKLASSTFERGKGQFRIREVNDLSRYRSFSGHIGVIKQLAFLPDGSRLVTLGDDGALKIWDLTLGQETLSIRAHERNGLALTVSPDGQTLFTSGNDGTVKIWDSRQRTSKESTR